MVHNTVITRTAALDGLIAEKLKQQAPMVVVSAKSLGGGKYRLQSFDGKNVSLISTEIPLHPNARLVEFTASAAAEFVGPLIVNLYSGRT